MHSHPDVLCHHELFNPSGIFTALPLRDDPQFDLGSLLARDADPAAFLEAVWRHNLGYHWLGFKITDPQQPALRKQLCQDPTIHKIVLRRRSALKAYLSRLIAEHTGRWEDYRTTETATTPIQVHVDYARLRAAVTHNQKFYQGLETQLAGPVTRLAYEDLLKSTTQQTLLHELGLRPKPLHAASRQQNPFPAHAMVSNLTTLVDQLKHDQDDLNLLNELNPPPAYQ
ncbi:hypothetical protein [Arenicella chitinivorans]|nr:hypothetical protein [Arenicella chitinivorans]